MSTTELPHQLQRELAYIRDHLLFTERLAKRNVITEDEYALFRKHLMDLINSRLLKKETENDKSRTLHNQRGN